MHKKIDTWKNYIEELFEDGNISGYQPKIKRTNSMPIMAEELKKSIAQIKIGKSLRLDN